jgi:hypothetical protein
MRLAFVGLGIAAVLMVAVTGCSSPYKTIQSQLRENQRVWQDQDVSDYRYRLQIGCFCPQEITQPVVIEVRDGNAVSITYADSGLAASNGIFQGYDTVGELFAVVQDAIDGKADEITVSYDVAAGY